MSYACAPRGALKHEVEVADDFSYLTLFVTITSFRIGVSFEGMCSGRIASLICQYDLVRLYRYPVLLLLSVSSHQCS